MSRFMRFIAAIAVAVAAVGGGVVAGHVSASEPAPAVASAQPEFRFHPTAFPTNCVWSEVSFVFDRFSGHCNNSNGGSYRTDGTCQRTNGSTYHVQGSRRHDGLNSGSACTLTADELLSAKFILYSTP